MKALILADPHSNIHALVAVWRTAGGADAIYCAGDLVDYGPFPMETLNWIRSHGVLSIQGNHDHSVIHAYRKVPNLHELPPAETYWRHHNAQRVGEEEIQFLEGLPEVLHFELDGICYAISHAYKNYDVIESPYAFNRHIDEKLSNHFRRPVRRLIFGHTHRQAVHYLDDDVCWINPGSVSYRRPDDPDQTAHYATIEDGVISLRRIEYDLSPVYRETVKHELFPHERQMSDWFFGPRNHEMRWRIDSSTNDGNSESG
jgi:predicted phosphodiesterase